MERTSPLSNYLKGFEAGGSVVGAGESFTISRAEALRKIAEFQLPFEYAWVVKIIQAAAAQNIESVINVRLKRTELDIDFQLPSLTLEKVENGFFDPAPKADASLDYLLSGLWSVGIGNDFPFLLSLEGEEQDLLWTDGELKRVPSQERRTLSRLCISLCPSKNLLQNIRERLSLAAVRAGLTRVLQENCFVSPIPCSVDGRRIDSLLNSPHYGISQMTFPLTLGYLEDLQPSLKLPTGTLLRAAILPGRKEPISLLGSHPSDYKAAALQNASLKMIDRKKASRETGGAYLLTSFWDKETSARNSKLTESRKYSQLFWVKSGAVVDSEFISKSRTHCAAALFLSAEGLDTDLSSFRLAESQEREQRKTRAVKALAESIFQLSEFEDSVEEVGKGMRRYGQWAGGALLAFGALSLPVKPLGLGLLAGGGALMKTAKQQSEERERALREAVQDLRLELLRALN